MRNIAKILFLVSFVVLAVGCSTVVGFNIDEAKFVFPNANVTPLGQVHAEKTKWMVLWAPTFKPEEIKEVYEQALAQKGGDVLINAQIKTVCTEYLVVWKCTFIADGTAAKMSVGKQILK